MSTETDAVLSDYLQAAGYRLTVWHVRCVESFLTAQGKRGGPAEWRLSNDLSLSADECHLLAQWEDAERLARKARNWGEVRRIRAAVEAHQECMFAETQP